MHVKIKKKINELISIFKPVDLGLEQGKKDEILRQRGIYLTAIASLIAKVISMVSLFITIPATLNYLGNELFGVWMTLSSLIAMLTFADMGIGNGIINKLSESINTNNISQTQKIITNAFILLTVIAVTIISSFT